MSHHTLFDQALTAIQARQNDEARKLLIEFVRENPRHEQAWMALASVMEDLDKAIDCLRRVLALNPDNAKAQEWLRLAEREKARQAAVAELEAEAEAEDEDVAIVEPGDETRPVPRLGTYLLEYNFITQVQLKDALRAQRKTGRLEPTQRLGDILIQQGAITAERLNFALEEQIKDEERPVPRLGKFLLEYKFITDEQLQAALVAQRQAAAEGISKRLGDILLEQGTITQERLGFAVREQSRSFFSQLTD